MGVGETESPYLSRRDKTPWDLDKRETGDGELGGEQPGVERGGKTDGSRNAVLRSFT